MVSKQWYGLLSWFRNECIQGNDSMYLSNLIAERKENAVKRGFCMDGSSYFAKSMLAPTVHCRLNIGFLILIL